MTGLVCWFFVIVGLNGKKGGSWYYWDNPIWLKVVNYFVFCVPTLNGHMGDGDWLFIGVNGCFQTWLVGVNEDGDVFTNGVVIGLLVVLFVLMCDIPNF